MNYVLIKSDNVIVHRVKAGIVGGGAGVGPRLGAGWSGGYGLAVALHALGPALGCFIFLKVERS